MTRYVVVTREGRLPVERFITVEAAANYIVRERKFADWTLLAQDADHAASSYRKLLPHERRVLEAKLYPSLLELSLIHI